ncbi:MAG TPA: ubiquinol-cytochrome C chaperone family protein [Pseudolabrys sp.]|jgi:cytochrome b pre-mRNA-processing protein 3|nr:ubiquinol-cytochrome C chaperone family protein [Pseudolabrys sp.]
MIFPLFRRRRPARPDTISALYGMIVAQARMPAFYRDYGVPDTVDGRFELIVLHMVLLLERLNGIPALRSLGQNVFDRFCQDMDHNLREMGVGDLAVPKQMRGIGQAFYGRAGAYRSALAASDEAFLVKALVRNIYGSGDAGPSGRLAAYVRQAVEQLKVLDEDTLATGTVAFPELTSVII